MDATCTIQDSIHVFSLVHKYVSRILGTYHEPSFYLKGRIKALLLTTVFFYRQAAYIVIYLFIGTDKPCNTFYCTCHKFFRNSKM